MATFGALTDVTSPDEVRACLGVSDEELSDTVVNLTFYFNTLTAQLNWYNAKLIPAYLAVPDTTPSADETAYANLFKTFCAWLSAKIIGTSLPQFSPRQITDGKAAQQRQLASPSDTLQNVEKQLDVVYPQLLAALEVLQPPSTSGYTAIHVGRFTPAGFDPITG